MISVVVPIYNEEELIVRFHEAWQSHGKLPHTMGSSVCQRWFNRFSLELLKGLQSLDSHVVVVELSRNWGHMGAISAGLQTARGAAVILMDGDFQDPPEVLPKLIDAWREGGEVVVAVRKSRQERRKILAKLFPLFYRVMGTLSDYPIPLNAGIFSLMSRKAVDSVNQMGERIAICRAARLGRLSEQGGLLRSPGQAGRRWQAFVHEPDQVRDGCDYELQLQTAAAQFRAILPGELHVCTAAFCMLLSSSVGSNRGLRRGSGGVLCGWLCGLLLLCMGVLGEYLGRVYDEVRSRPSCPSSTGFMRKLVHPRCPLPNRPAGFQFTLSELAT
jgi:polyisoprenyl-phosphate glycosyltransferase